MATGLKAFADIYRIFVIQLEPTEVCHEPITKPKYQYFFGYISANVLYAIRLNGTFSYVLTGCKGSVNDASLLQHARSKSLKLYANRFYVRDAGFGAYTGLLVPYIGIRYHLNN
ncbi:uncharacterized protein FFNC_09471 [Fusarium fujikuroi]|nr:uncharacterized protein FFNC_09471 [Fusarium fujikuroi]